MSSEYIPSEINQWIKNSLRRGSYKINPVAVISDEWGIP